MAKQHEGLIWVDRKRNGLGLPWTFTTYSLSADRLFIDSGFLSSREDEVRLYRISDLTVTRSLWQRIIGTGTIHINSSDRTLGDFDIVNIRQVMAVKETISRLVEESRRKARVFMREENVHMEQMDDYEDGHYDMSDDDDETEGWGGR